MVFVQMDESGWNQFCQLEIQRSVFDYLYKYYLYKNNSLPRVRELPCIRVVPKGRQKWKSFLLKKTKS
jgi:hypothetical protein